MASPPNTWAPRAVLNAPWPLHGCHSAQDLDFQPDPQYTTAAFTNCFGGYNATSSGNWSDKGSGNYYFAVNYGGWATVRTLSVNY